MSEGKLWEGEVVAGNSAAIPPASAEAVSILFPFHLLLTILHYAGESIYVAAQSARLGGYFIKDGNRSFGYKRQKEQKKGEMTKEAGKIQVLPL